MGRIIFARTTTLSSGSLHVRRFFVVLYGLSTKLSSRKATSASEYYMGVVWLTTIGHFEFSPSFASCRCDLDNVCNLLCCLVQHSLGSNQDDTYITSEQAYSAKPASFIRSLRHRHYQLKSRTESISPHSHSFSSWTACCSMHSLPKRDKSAPNGQAKATCRDRFDLRPGCSPHIHAGSPLSSCLIVSMHRYLPCRPGRSTVTL